METEEVASWCSALNRTRAIWLVFRDGVLVFSGDYGQVEDWLDQAENSARCTRQADTQKDPSGRSLQSRWLRDMALPIG
jgi:hypothetical protein